MQPSEDPARALARRLRELREQEWSDVSITLGQLAELLSVSVPLILSWESQKAIPRRNGWSPTQPSSPVGER